MAQMIAGAQLYTVREHTKTLEDLKATLKRVADIGYSAVQVSGFGPIDPKDVARLMQDNGLYVAATHLAWERFRTDLDAVIAEHKLWGCPHPAIGGLPAEYRSADGVMRFRDELTPIAEKLAREGMDFSYHNHSHELAKYGSRTWLDMLYSDIPPAVLKAEIDVYWVQAGGGDPAWWVNKCAGREPLLHVKDMMVTPEREQRFAEIGEGNLNWPAIMKEAKAGGVQYCLVEQDRTYERDPFESLAISFRSLKAMGLR